MRTLPSGDVTFAFLDVVGSTRLFQEHGNDFVDALRRVQAEIAEQVTEHGGVLVKTQGDGAFAAFEDPAAAVDALVAVQRRRAADSGALRLSLRAGAHRGPAVPIDGDYVALAVHVAARICSAARADQVLVSGAVAEALPGRTSDWTDFDERLLRDVAAPVRSWLVAGPVEPPRAQPVRPTNIAAPHSSFVGRHDVAAELSERLTRPGLVTLVGTGGLGKTRLASEVALRSAAELLGGAWLVELATVSRPQDVAGAIASALDLRRESGDPLTAAARGLRERGPCLVVLDNCEHVIDEAAGCAEKLVAAAPDLRLLCTSREPLSLAGESVIRLRPLTAERADGGDQSAAARLFRDRAATAGRTIADHELSIVEQICADLDGLPLAIELAAGRAGDMSLDALANVVRSPADHPEAFSRRGGDDRQRTLENVVRWSDNLLAPPLRTALRVLSAFPGGFSPSTARFALGYLRERGIEVAPDVSPLARRSLVDLDGDRFRMLHTVRSLAASWLGESPELSTAVEGMLLPWADQWARERVRLPYDQLRRDVRTELPNLLAAVHLGAIRCSVDVAYPLHLLCSVAPHEGAGPRLGATLRTVLKCPDTGASAVRSKVAAATMLSGIGVGEVPVDRAVMANWVRIADEDGDPELRAWSRSRLAQLLPVPEEVELARQWLREALELCGDSPEGLRNRARSYGGMGYVEHLAGELERAVDFYEQAASASQAASNSELVLIVRANKAEALLDLDRPAEALAAAQLALAYVDGQAAMAAVVSAMSGEAYAALGHADEGRALLAEAVDKLTELATLDPSLQYYVDRARAVLTAVN